MAQTGSDARLVALGVATLLLGAVLVGGAESEVGSHARR